MLIDTINNFLSGARARFYSYRPGIPSGVGVGVEGLGLMKPQSEPIDAVYDLRKTVRGDLGPIAGGINHTVQGVTPVSLKGSGAHLTGALALQQLAQFQAGSTAP